MTNEVTTKTKTVSMMSAQKTYIENIGKGLSSLIGNMTEYQSLCGYNVLSAINTALSSKGLNHLSPNVDRETINDAIKFAVIYQLNTDNKEIFVITRNYKKKVNDKEYTYTKIECKPQYKGQLKIISTFGKDVKKVYPEWIVREGDEFTYQTFKGVDIIPPTWTPKSADGKVLRVVVPVKYKDDFIDYRIAERESVAVNIKAQIKQSLMYDKNKDTILALIKDMTLDQLLDSKEVAPYINDTYTGISREEMIITKLIINATKRVAIDFKSAVQRELLEKTFDNSNVYEKTHTAAQMLENEKTLIEMQEPIEEEITIRADDNGEVKVNTIDSKIQQDDSKSQQSDEKVTPESLDAYF